MNDKDLNKNIENLIIKGLIKEAEQENFDFQVALRNMSHEDFMNLLDTPYRKNPIHPHSFAETEDVMIDLPGVTTEKNLELVESSESRVEEPAMDFDVADSNLPPMEDMENADMNIKEKWQRQQEIIREKKESLREERKIIREEKERKRLEEERKRQEEERLSKEKERMLKEVIEYYKKLEAEEILHGNSASEREIPVARSSTEFVPDIQRASLSIRSTSKIRFSKILPWLIATVATAAVLLAVLIPSYQAMNARLCESALYASAAYISSSKGDLDISSSSPEEIKRILPTLERNYNQCIQRGENTGTYSEDLRETGWILAVAYLKVHKKNEAVKVLQVLARQYADTEFGTHCEQLLKQLN